MMNPSVGIPKLLRVLQFRKHLKELTSACKRINKDACHEFVTYRHGTTEKSTNQKKSTKFNVLRSKMYNYKQKSRSAYRLSTRVRPKTNVSSSSSVPLQTITTTHQSLQQLAEATASVPANVLMLVKQSYKPLHAKSTQFNKNTIAVTKDTPVRALYAISNWVFIEIVDSGQTGFVPIYCLQSPAPASDAPSQNNLSLLNVSIYEKPLSIGPGGFMSSIGPCHTNLEEGNATVVCSRSMKTRSYTRYSKDQSNLSRQISNISLHAYEHDAYGTLNLTPCQSLSFSALDSEPIVHPGGRRLRVMGNYQRQFVGDISVLESEVVTLVDEHQSDNDWRLVRRGDGRQGYVPKHIIAQDKMF